MFLKGKLKRPIIFLSETQFYYVIKILQEIFYLIKQSNSRSSFFLLQEVTFCFAEQFSASLMIQILVPTTVILPFLTE